MSDLLRVARMNLPWLGWTTEATCDMAWEISPLTGRKTLLHVRVGTLWCWGFVLLGLVGLMKVGR